MAVWPGNEKPFAVTVTVPGVLATDGAGDAVCNWIVWACSTTRRARVSSTEIWRAVSRRWRASERELLLVLAHVALDLVEPHVREVVLLDGRLEAAVDLVDLSEDLLGLCLLRCHAPGIRVRSGGNAERAYRENECLRLSSPAGGHQLSRSGSTGAVPEGAGPHKFGTLATSSDVCNRFPSQKLPLSG